MLALEINPEDFVMFHYFTDRAECTKFASWNTNLTQAMYNIYDPQ